MARQMSNAANVTRRSKKLMTIFRPMFVFAPVCQEQLRKQTSSTTDQVVKEKFWLQAVKQKKLVVILSEFNKDYITVTKIPTPWIKRIKITGASAKNTR